MLKLQEQRWACVVSVRLKKQTLPAGKARINLITQGRNLDWTNHESGRFAHCSSERLVRDQ
eukprot:557503-Amphidinium_carterae.1